MPKTKIWDLKHLVRYGTAADQKYLLKPFDATYDALIINANILAHMPNALALMLQQLKKPFFIDPQTHAFQHGVEYLESTANAGKIKKSVLNLIQAYGEPVKTKIVSHKKALEPKDFASTHVLKEFCRNVTKFQTKTIDSLVSKGDSAKYYAYLKKKGYKTELSFSPTLVVAPYFYLTPQTFDVWLAVNIRCLNEVLEAEKKTSLKIGAQIVIDSKILSNPDLVKKLVAEYAKNPPSVFLLWIDSFVEQAADADLLRAYVEFVEKLSVHAPVINLYGSFFSVALMMCGILPKLRGVAHSLEYGESRPVVPVGGGVPVSKFYLPVLHSRLPFRFAFRATKALGGLTNPTNYYSKVCGCRECRAIIKSKPEDEFYDYGRTKKKEILRRKIPTTIEWPTPETKNHCVRHYMWNKHLEYSKPIACKDLLANLSSAFKDLKGHLDLEYVNQCAIWVEIIREKLNKNASEK